MIKTETVFDRESLSQEKVSPVKKTYKYDEKLRQQRQLEINEKIKLLPKQQMAIKARIVDDRTMANNLNFETVQQYSKDFGMPASVVYTTYAGFKSIVQLAN